MLQYGGIKVHVTWSVARLQKSDEECWQACSLPCREYLLICLTVECLAIGSLIPEAPIRVEENHRRSLWRGGQGFTVVSTTLELVTRRRHPP